MAFRKAMGRFASGVTVVTTVADDRVHGMVANGFMSVSLDPPLALVSLSRQSRMHELLTRSGRFGVSVLDEGQQALSWHFAGRPGEPVRPRFTWACELPFIAGALAHVGCDVVDAHAAGDHTLHVGRVEHLDCRDGRPLLFYTGAYRTLDVGLTDDAFFF